MPGKIPTLKDIRHGEWEALQKQVEAAKGDLLLLVHPYYRDTDPAFRERTEALIKRSKKPVVILERFSDVQKTKDRLEKLGAPPHLILPTAKTSPAPVKDLTPKGAPDYDGALDELALRLEKAGARNIYIGGQYAHESNIPIEYVRDHERGWLPAIRVPAEKTVTLGCVGAVYKTLIESDRFRKVRLMPKVVHPSIPEHPLRSGGTSRKTRK